MTISSKKKYKMDKASDEYIKNILEHTNTLNCFIWSIDLTKVNKLVTL